jgi:beta-lactamase regulating signal transducer with metallopeptidase domain
MSAEFFTACERLLSATANGVYQGILITIIAGLALRLFVRTNAATRHAVWFGVLLLVVALIPAHLLLSWPSHPKVLAAPARPVSPVIAVAPSPLDAEGTPDSPVAYASLPNLEPEEADGSPIDGAPNTAPPEPQGEWASSVIASKDGPDATVTEKAVTHITPATLKPSFWNLEKAISLPHSICLGLVSAWVLLASVRAGMMLRQISEVRRIKTTSNLPSTGLQAPFERLRDSLTVRRNVRLRISSQHPTAVVLGFVHPVVLLPEDMDKDANVSEVEHVLRHELAHVDRWDDWGNLAQQFIQAALFFHPAIWWISTRLTLEREIACDDRVLDGHERPRAYALTLANVASRMTHGRPSLAPGVSNNNSQLQQRITMILDKNRDRSPRLAKSRLGFITTATALLAVLAISAGPRLVLAQPQPETPAASEPDNVAPPSPNVSVTVDSPAALPPNGSGPDSGPRIKSDSNDNDFVPGALPPPNAPIAAALPPTPALASVDQIRDVPPVPPVPPAPRLSKRNQSVEERLDRIERILENLEANGGMKGRYRKGEDFSIYQGQNRPFVPDGKPLDRTFVPDGKPLDSNPEFAFKRAAEEAERAAEVAERAAEAGERAAEAGQRHAEQAMRDIERLKSKDLERMQVDLRHAESEGPLKELQALRAAREALQGQMQKIERQIKHIEENQNRQKNSNHGRPDGSGATPKEEQPEPENTL